ncbi:DUF6843 domain-containing protein [Paenibacillus hodogayensis]|uniref:DUF6843 domain-containing protein n=1 Tax=Paenibacillus hodogayensis TaxID=279208 RepID=A0ABV5W1X7_9BACL
MSKTRRRWPKFAYAAAAFAAAGLLFMGMTVSRYPLHVYIVPEGFVGEVVVTFDQPDSPPLPYRKRTYTYNIPATGELGTSSPMKSGTVELYSRDATGNLTRVGVYEPMLHGMVTSSSESVASDGSRVVSPTVVRFFAGTAEQYEQFLTEKEAGKSSHFSAISFCKFKRKK